MHYRRIEAAMGLTRFPARQQYRQKCNRLQEDQFIMGETS
jgi:hypothetical protein